jgi:uncharacterized membrane protein
MNTVNVAPENLGVAAAPLLAGPQGSPLTPAVLPSFTPQSTVNPPLVLESETTSRKAPGVVVEKHYRSLLKAVSWRATGTLDTILISLLITGQIKLAVSIGLVEVFTKISLFYLHERLWNKIPLGRAKAPEDYAI